MSLSTCIIHIYFDDGDDGYFVRWEDDGFRWTENIELAAEVSYYNFFNIKERLLEMDGVKSVYEETLY